MQYLLSVITETSDLATAQEQADIDAFNDRLQTQGYWVFAGGLTSPSAANVIDNRGERPIVTDGPFVETKEHLIGFWVIEVPHGELALELAAAGSRACNRKIEVRPFH